MADLNCQVAATPGSQVATTPSGTTSDTCFLCKAGHHLTSPSQWISVDAQRYISSKGISEDGLVCSTCRRDITKVLSNDAFVPRWTKPNLQKKCHVKGCTDTAFTSLACKATPTEINQIFTSLGLECSYSDIPIPLPPCTRH